MSREIPDPLSRRSPDSFDYILTCASGNDVPGIRKLVGNGCPPTFANAVGQSALHIGALWGSADAVRVLLELKANPRAQNDRRRATPLHVAATGKGPPERRAECVRLLIDCRGDPEMTDHSGAKAVDLADDDEVRLALGEAPLILHQCVGVKNAMRLEDAIVRVKAGQLPGLTLDRKDAAGLTALHYAVYEGWHKGVEMLAAAGATVCTQANDGETPLHLAVQHGMVETTRQLIELQANPNVKDQDKEADPRYKSRSFDWDPELHRTPLHYAAELSNLVAIQLLSEARADSNALDSKMHSPLYLALQGRDGAGFKMGSGVRVGNNVATVHGCLGAITGEVIAGSDGRPRWPVEVKGNCGHTYLLKEESLESLAIEAFKTLLGARADVNAGMGESRTGLHDASRGGHAELVALMLEARASLNQQDRAGFSALHLAVRSKHHDVVKVLVSARAALDLKTEVGKTAAELAMKNGCGQAILDLLAEQKAGVHITEHVVPADSAEFVASVIHGRFSETATMGDLTAEQRAAFFID
ncbi:unnamed protein product [Prorocentrum cordatum]|uniref:Uncharacterized protein n=1 Tax=Prorocentrum cordatum TaxID=2364126 RepID=A0ABN9X7Y6_9DINO|nr:unnamed protein product [Polarella glacialis]